MITKGKIQLVRSLADKNSRLDAGLFVAEGRKLVSEALASGYEVESLYVVEESSCSAQFQCYGFAESVSAKDMERMSKLKTPSDVLAVIRIPDSALNPDTFGNTLALYLDCIQDPGNLGTIIRIADWFGIENVACSPDCADIYNPKTVQATMGALFRVNVCHVAPDELFRKTAARKVPVYGTFLDGKDIYDAELSSDGIIMLGSEGHGISPLASQFVSKRLFIPPFPVSRHGSESLNVAVAAAVTCAEFRRRMR